MAIAGALETGISSEVSRDRLWETNSKIAGWTRHSGTAEEREAFQYVKATLEEYGLRTTWLEHPALISYPISARMMVVDSRGQSLGEYACLGTAFGASVDGLEAEIVDLGFGTPEDYARTDVTGKVVLLNGLATPNAVYAAEQAGAVGQVFINDDHLHYMIVSSVWGTPTPSSAGRLPKTPSVSIVEQDGLDLRKLIGGSVRVRLTTNVFRGWQQTPLVVGELDGQKSDEFVMFSGHLDSWEVGAMDNGSANATMLEVARLLAGRKDELYRGLRLCFWSGHSHGRYSGSTWYADNFWEELYDRCVAHVNVDSTGARGATFYERFPATLELGDFGAAVIQQHTGQAAKPHRMSRAGDMSFHGIGIPSLFMSLSQVPFQDSDSDYVSIAFGKLIGGKMPWWWHTSEDTLDKVDLDVLVKDTQIYTTTLWHLCHEPLLPMDFRPVAADIFATLSELQGAVGSHLDLAVTVQRAEELVRAANVLAEQCEEAKAGGRSVEEVNGKLKALSRILVPVAYTAAGRFDHDPAWGMGHIPLLVEAQKLAKLPVGSDEYHFLRTQLVRNCNAVNFALREAIAVVG